ncbi:STAS domain-containing protein [Geomicrobium sp. JCM 19038]|uniref:STAS domain-containing protein n=1 Tax=Geomicrobium sp. JCM 19038 TaxID=1460635 RepID=UPI00045F3736|nr:STAS domain-containing protein [Geomicrobium sp. JCM 19038]GAK07310.1 RsbR, positive regulator of sigma-B [Geomicrobium sp. JCM 19038]
MNVNNQLYTYMINRSEGITNRWFEDLESDEGVYGSKNESVITKLKKQNHDFHIQFFNLFKGDGVIQVDSWIARVAKDEYHQNTPLDTIIGEFMNNQLIYIELFEEYLQNVDPTMDVAEQRHWLKEITKQMNDVIVQFTKEYESQSQMRTSAQQKTIVELSCPILMLSQRTALLPVVGDIDTYRAKIMFEQTLSQSAEKKITELFIDLSGVPIIDTMVAQQIFQLIEGLRLLGVSTTLSGLRPEIAQTAVQLGIQFENISIKSSLAQVVEERGMIG